MLLTSTIVTSTEPAYSAARALSSGAIIWQGIQESEPRSISCGNPEAAMGEVVCVGFVLVGEAAPEAVEAESDAPQPPEQ